MYGARARPVVVGEETLKNVENIFSAGKNKVAKTEEGVTPFLRVQHQPHQHFKCARIMKLTVKAP